MLAPDGRDFVNQKNIVHLGYLLLVSRIKFDPICELNGWLNSWLWTRTNDNSDYKLNLNL